MHLEITHRIEARLDAVIYHAESARLEVSLFGLFSDAYRSVVQTETRTHFFIQGVDYQYNDLPLNHAAQNSSLLHGTP